jgi:hypothetical protein
MMVKSVSLKKISMIVIMIIFHDVIWGRWCYLRDNDDEYNWGIKTRKINIDPISKFKCKRFSVLVDVTIDF